MNITRRVEEVVEASGIREGLCLVNSVHITSSVFVNDDESGLHEDFDRWLEELAPHEPTGTYAHNLTGEDNADAHLKRQIMGREVVAVTGDRLDLGTREQGCAAAQLGRTDMARSPVCPGSFNGRRKKRVLVKIISE